MRVFHAQRKRTPHLPSKKAQFLGKIWEEELKTQQAKGKSWVEAYELANKKHRKLQRKSFQQLRK